MRAALIGLVGTGLLTACTTTTEPVSLGGGTYLIATNARGGVKGNGQLTADTVNAAHAFCAKEGKRAVVIQDSARGAQGWTPQNIEVRFRCE